MTYPVKVDIPESSVTLLDITDEQPGYARAQLQGSEVFMDERGELIQDEETLDRLEGLSIPPAWEDVWICAHEDGYLQSTGRDAQGRKQYIYHALWHEYRAAQKYARILEFGRSLPTLRAHYDSDLRRRRLSRDRVSALGCAIIDRTAMRVGHELYTRSHGSHGLTTLYKAHCDCGSTTARFAFTGKSGVQRHVKLRDRRLCYQLGKLMELPGDYLFQHQETHSPKRLHAEHVNHYIASACGEQMSAKCFRTWHGSVRAFDALIRSPHDALRGGGDSARDARATRLKHAIEVAATFLGNTTSVCRDHYIHSTLLDAARDGRLWDYMADQTNRTGLYKGGMRGQEELLIDVLETLS